MKNLLFFLAAVLTLALSASCNPGGDDDMMTPGRCDALLFNEDVNPKLTAWQEAATAYANDPSTANCNAYKSTGDAWLDAIARYEDCATIYTQTWRDAVDDARMELAAIPCN